MADLGQILGGTSVQVSTSVSPPITIGLGGDGAPATDAPAPVAALLSFLKPQFSVVQNGATLTTVAPWGAPNGPSDWPTFLLGLVAVGLAVGVGVYALSKAL